MPAAFYSTVAALTLAWRGALPCHASAVEIDGRAILIAGPSGAGKSTLCALVPRFHDATAGRVTVDGHDVRDLTLASLRRAVGVVPQDVHLFAGTVEENLRMARPDATAEELEEAARALGQSRTATLRRVTLPLAAPGIAGAAALVFLATTTELTTTLMLGPTGLRTLATRFWSLTGSIDYVSAAPYAALMIGVSAPVATSAVTFRTSRPSSRSSERTPASRV